MPAEEVTPQNDAQDLGAARTAAARRGMLFGIPLGELGWFQSLLMGTAAGFAAFFLTCFISILTIQMLNSWAHRDIDIAISYREIALPAGITVLLLAYAYLGFQWIRRKIGAK